MRSLLILLAFMLSLPQTARATVVCPPMAFVVTFEPNSTVLTSEAQETLGAAYNRGRQCDVPVFTILANGRDPIGRDRAQLVRTELVALGLSVAVPVNIGVDEPAADEEAPPDHVMVFIEFDY